jgi:tetratricopeptide (TPR) repeat protein
MRQVAMTLLLTLVFLDQTFACLNGESKVLKDGSFLYEDLHGYVPKGHFFEPDKKLERTVLSLDSLYNKTKDLDYLSDKGIVLILLKRYDEAVRLYQRIEKIKPGRYSTASNLGTAYELLGQNENALRWISRAVAIDPASHNHSEWIHVNILEAKIKGPQFYKSTFLAGEDFGTAVKPATKKTKEELVQLRNALYYQLNERVSFIEPKEPIVAELLFALGNVSLLIGEKSDALQDYKKAIEYGFTDPLIHERMKEAGQQARVNRNAKTQVLAINNQRSYRTAWIIGIASLSLIALAFVLYRHNRRRIQL